MTALELGIPAPSAAPSPVPRRVTRQVMVGSVPVGGDAPVSVQSMTTTRTADIDATLQQVAEALPAIAAKSQIPVIADIHFQSRYVFAAIVSCPSCGRAQVDVYAPSEQVSAAFEGFPVPLRIAVMGCVVNGPGEAREADIGVSSGNGKGEIFVRGEVIKTVPEHQIVETLLEDAPARYGSPPPAHPEHS